MLFPSLLQCKYISFNSNQYIFPTLFHFDGLLKASDGTLKVKSVTKSLLSLILHDNHDNDFLKYSNYSGTMISLN